MNQIKIGQLDFKPLFKIGFTPGVIKRFIALFWGKTYRELFFELQNKFSPEEKTQIGEQIERMSDPQEVTRFFEQVYESKTKTTLEKEAERKLIEYFRLFIGSVKRINFDLETIGQMSSKEVEQIRQALDKKDFDQVEKILQRYQG